MKILTTPEERLLARVSAIHVIVGAAGFLVLQLVLALSWSRLDQWGGKPKAWFLNADASTAFGAGACFVVAFACAVAFRLPPRSRLLAGGALVAGAVASMTLVLFAIGPGNLWPIVLIFGSAIVVPSSSAGYALGALARWRFR